jgi:ribosomal protein S18 acetylase RimI-like enzyme
MREIRILEGESVERLYGAFMGAFADYAVPVSWSLDEFAESNARRGLDLSISLGAYEGERILGFILNGRGSWGGRPAAYDLGTGVLPEARGGGLSGELAARLVGFLPGRGIARYVLEVLRDNAPAIKTYERAGFRVSRLLECPGGSFVEPGLPEPVGLEILELPAGAAFPRSLFASFRDWEPTWQNSDDSVARMPGRLVVLGARLEGEILGGLVAGVNGSIWQLAVARGARRRGIGTALLRALAARSGPSLRYVNVQANDEASLGLLARAGISGGPGQYEMTRELGDSGPSSPLP